MRFNSSLFQSNVSILKHAANVKVCHSGFCRVFWMILTLTAVVSHVAFLTLAVVLGTRAPVHTPNVTVLDCGHNGTYTYKQTFAKVNKLNRIPSELQNHAQIFPRKSRRAKR